MENKISYGPHLFPYGPEPYIRASNRDQDFHRNIRQTLIAAFDGRNPDSILCQLAKRLEIGPDPQVNISFMNYGNTELVYLVNIADKVKVATLINQPHTPLGRVRKEFDNLGRLVEIDPRFVVKPLAYFASPRKGHELYASEYIENAMCIMRQGIYNPLPNYHFEMSSSEIISAVNSNIIALLVNYYDSERGRGLAKTQINGNDFIFTRGFDNRNPNSVQRNMRLISAREFVKAIFNKYLNILRQEFLDGTDRSDKDVLSGKIKVNHRSAVPMTLEEINKGIEIDLELRSHR